LTTTEHHQSKTLPEGPNAQLAENDVGFADQSDRLAKVSSEAQRLYGAVDLAEEIIRHISAKYSGARKRNLFSRLRYALRMRFSRSRVQSSRYNLIRNSVFFDKTYYLASNPDVAAAKIDPVVHYLQFGGREGRNPGPVFSEAQYRALSPDVAATPLSALEHYESVGREEGRRVVAPKMRPTEVPGEAEVTQTAAPAETAAGNLASGEALYRKRCQLSLFRVRTEGPISFSPRAEPFFLGRGLHFRRSKPHRPSSRIARARGELCECKNGGGYRGHSCRL
jgi:hypothetical protein